MIRSDEVFFQLQPAATPQPAPRRAAAAPRATAVSAARGMLRVTSRHNPRLRGGRAPRRLVARPPQGAASACSKASIWSPSTSTASARPRRCWSSRSALARPRVAALAARVPPRDVLAVRAALFAETVDAARRRRRAGGRAPRRRRAAPPPARFHLLLDDVQDPGNVGTILRTAAAAGVDAGAAVEALRVRVVAQGAARRAGRAFPDRRSSRTSTSPAWARALPRARRRAWSPRCARGGDRSLRGAAARAAGPSPSATKAPGCRRRCVARRDRARHDPDAAAAPSRSTRPRRRRSCCSSSSGRAARRAPSS